MTQKRCVLQYMHSQISPDGSVNLCCNSLDFREKPVKLGDLELNNMLNSHKHKKIRLDIEKGKRPEICSMCWKDEDLGIESYRQQMNDRYSHYEYLYKELKEDGSLDAKIKFLDLRFNNTCNLKCVMCSSQFSTSWIAEEKKMLEEVNEKSNKEHLASKINEYKSESFKWSKEFENIEGIMEFVDDLERINFAGGEPLLAKAHTSFLESLIERGVNKNIMLSYNTNTCYITQEILDLWSNFKSVKLLLSIDAVNEQLEYIRYPIKWNEIIAKLDLIENSKHSNIYCTINLTLNALNVPYLTDIIDWKLKSKYKRIHYNEPTQDYLFYMMPLVYPNHLSIQVLPKDVKIKIIKDLDIYENTVSAKFMKAFKQVKDVTIKHMLDQDKSELLPQFIDYCNALDKTRNLDFRKTFPIFKDL
jgi:organic radical activating enzyme